MEKERGYRKTKNMVMMAIFIAIILLQAVVPVLGYIPLGVMNATIIQATVAVGAVFLGLKRGMGLGFVFGLTSMWKNTFMPNVSSFVFSPFTPGINGESGGIRSLIVCLIPRICIGAAAFLVYDFFEKRKKKGIGLMMAGVCASAVNTILVMGFIYILFAREYAAAANMPLEGLLYFIMGIIGTQGLAEAIVSGVIVFGVCSALQKYMES